jgi:hypothetical protein
MRSFQTWNTLPRAERAILAASIVFIGATAAFFSFWGSNESIIWVIKQFGLGTLLGCIGVTIFSLVALCRERARNPTGADRWRDWFVQHRVFLGVWMACVCLAISVFPKGNRILMDEIIVLATSKAIHEEREPVTPSSFQFYNGITKLTNAYVDKRPYFYATAVSFAHDVLGYSPKNAFYTNMLFGGATLLLVGLVGRRLGGSEAAGTVAMISLTAVPLFCEHVTGGGIDIANLFCIILLLLTAMLYWERPSPHAGRALLGVGVLLAYSRYESILYFAIPVALLVGTLRREGRFFIDWPVLVYLPAIVPLLGIHYLTFSHSAQSFQLGEQGYTEAFSLKYVPENVAHALNFFLNTEHLLSNSPLVFLAGVICVMLLIVSGLNPRQPRPNFGPGMAFWIYGFVSLVCLALLMAYSWGKLDEVIASRLSLPLYLLFVLSIAAVARHVTRPQLYFRLAALLFAISLYWSSFPVAAKQYATKVYTGVQRQRILEEFNEQQPDRHFAVLNNVTNYWLTRDVYAVSPVALNGNPLFLANMLSSGEFRRIYLIQTDAWDEKQKKYLTSNGDVISFPLETEPVSQDLVTGDLRVRIALVKPSNAERLRALAPGGK